MLTGEDLRKMATPLACDNKISRQLKQQNRKKFEKKLTRQTLKKRISIFGEKLDFEVEQNQKRRDQYHNLSSHVDIKELRPLKLQFLKLSVNPKPLSKLQDVKDLVNVYLTQESIINNFEKVFGYRNETLSIRFYNYLAEGYKGVRIYIPTFITKLIGLIDEKPLQMNYFGFKLLDSDLNGFVYASDIADIIQNALEYCPEANVEKVYPTLVGPTFQRSHSDKRCRCALY